MFGYQIPLHHLKVFHCRAEGLVGQCKVQARFRGLLLVGVQGLSCSNRFVRLSQVREPALAEREIEMPRLPSGSYCRSPQITRGVSPKLAAKPATASKMCSFCACASLLLPGCAYTTISVACLLPLPIGIFTIRNLLVVRSVRNVS